MGFCLLLFIPHDEHKPAHTLMSLGISRFNNEVKYTLKKFEFISLADKSIAISMYDYVHVRWPSASVSLSVIKNVVL
jgi:hypothetical protein